MFVTTLVVTVFAFLLTFAQPAHAAGEAKWKDGAIVYEGDTYKRREDIKADTLKLPEGSKIYAFIDSQADAGPDGAIQIIYFGKDDDPLKAQKANYVIYDYKDPDGFANPTGKTTITLTPMTTAQQNEETESCTVEGVGWVVCPLTNFLSEAMDKLFVVMSEFLTVRPVQTDQESALYRAWSMMRNIANVAFVMAFMVVIYSQLTNIGLSSYGIKRMLPRLIIAAILVNVSYWICAVAIDISNIFGYSLYDILMSMRDNLVGAEGNGWEKVTFHDMGAFLLAGGTTAAAAAIGVYSFTAGAGAGIFMLLPILLGILISALVALLVMAARQAVITILVIMAPLAFVAYLLPNTEKYFKKWTDLLSTMLMLFPMFAIVVGGSQLAGDAIIQNAGSSINLIILGMAVKVAPVVITPFLLKFSGSLLGKVAGIVNNPGKGIMDRTKNFAQERRDSLASKQLANSKNPNFLARGAQRIDANKRKREGWKKANDSRRDANWANSQAYSDIHGYGANSENIKAIGENRANQHVAAMRANDATVQGLDIRARASKLDLDVSQARVDANWEEIKTGDTRSIAVPPEIDIPRTTVAPSALAVSALANYHNERRTQADAVLASSVAANVEERRAQSAKNMQTNSIADALQNNTNLQKEAGGIDPNGGQRALADALKKRHDVRGEAVKTAGNIIAHSNLHDDDIVKLTRGVAVGGISATEEIREAAISKIAGGKNVKAMQDMLDTIDVDALTENQRITLSDELRSNGSKPKYVSTSGAAKIAQNGTPLGAAGVDTLIISAINGNKYGSAEVLVTQEDITLDRVADVIRRKKTSGVFNQAALDAFNTQLDEVYANSLYKGRVGERDKHLRKIRAELGGPPLPTP